MSQLLNLMARVKVWCEDEQSRPPSLLLKTAVNCLAEHIDTLEDGSDDQHIRWREKATPYNSQPSRLQNNRHAYNSHRYVYKTRVTSTNQPLSLQFATVTSTKQVVNCRRDGCEL